MGHILFADNYYTSPTLASFFLENGTHLCGTIRANRYNFPRDLVNTDLDKGTAVLFYNTDTPMIATKYRAEKDKAGGKPKVVFMSQLATNQSWRHTGRYIGSHKA